MNVLLAVIVVAILYTLFSGLFALMRPQADKTRLVRALTARVVLSIGLFATLLCGAWLGWWGR